MSKDTKIAIIGDGNVGTALAKGLREADYEIQVAGHDSDEVTSVSQWGDMIILAVPFQSVDEVARTAGDKWNGKTLVDVVNALDDDGNLALGFNTSEAEELQQKVPEAHVVKAFNTIFAQHMSDGRAADQQLTVLAAGDDDTAKKNVMEIAKAIGFDAVDAGPLRNARELEPLGYLNIQLGYKQGMGQDIGFRLVHA